MTIEETIPVDPTGLIRALPLLDESPNVVPLGLSHGGQLHSISVQLDSQLALAIYKALLRIRVIDTRMILMQRQGRVGFYGACTGQEAVPIATAFAAEKSDWMFPALREQAIMLVRGFPLQQFVAQVFGNEADVLKGRQMPSHMSGKSVNQASWGSCIGTQLPHAIGFAWAAKKRGGNEVAFAFCGDGATSEGDFHAAMTFASVFKVPAVIVCQNNHWSISVPSARQSASQTFALKGRAYGIQSLRVDGNDPVALFEVIRRAREHASCGHGPVFIEAVTYRIGAHSTSDDPTRYRSQDEVELWQRQDPIERMHAYVKELGLVTDNDRQQWQADFDNELIEAIKEVEPLGPPAIQSLFEDVYADLPWHLREQQALLSSMIRPNVPSHG